MPSEHQYPIDRAHLTGTSRPSPPIARYAPSPELQHVVKRYWVPVWSLTQPQTQSTLQYPACLVVISNTYARLYGTTRGLSTITLEGDGWAVGTLLKPAAGYALLGGSVADLTDRHIPLDEVDFFTVSDVVAHVRSAMTEYPARRDSHRQAIAHLERFYASLLPIDEEGLMVNRLVTVVKEHRDLTRVSELAELVGLSERTLQRLVERRVGVTPKWLIQRRRLHDAVESLKMGDVTSLSDLAVALGYADQAHFTTDFRTVTGLTPGQFLEDQPRGQTTGRLWSDAAQPELS